MSKSVFEEYSAYYDLLYRDKDYAAEADYVDRLLQSAAPGARSLLEFGSGSGKHAVLLASRGDDVRGIEQSAAMVALANNASLPPGAAGSFTCAQGDVRRIDLGREFDAILALFHVVSYQTSNADLGQTFRAAARHLRPGGVFLFDVWHGPAVLAQRPEVRIKRVADSVTRLTRIAEPHLDTNANVVTVRYTMLAEASSDDRLLTFGEEHRMRYLFPTEIDLLASQAGLAVERSEEFLTGQPPSEKSWGVAYLLRKQP